LIKSGNGTQAFFYISIILSQNHTLSYSINETADIDRLPLKCAVLHLPMLFR